MREREKKKTRLSAVCFVIIYKITRPWRNNREFSTEDREQLYEFMNGMCRENIRPIIKANHNVIRTQSPQT